MPELIWLKYPENQPAEDVEYLCWTENGAIVGKSVSWADWIECREYMRIAVSHFAVITPPEGTKP